MHPVEIRPFRRSDREQLTELVNAHVDAVVPGRSVSVNAVLSQLEREPGEFVVDPWVIARETLVAVRRDRLVAAAHLTRFAGDDRVSTSYRDAGEIRWLVCWPRDDDAGDALAAACVRTMERWGVAKQWADGSLPVPSVYGIPDAWPHVRGILERAGFAHDGRAEIVLVARIDDLPAPATAPVEGLELRRVLGRDATAFVARRGGDAVAVFEVRSDVSSGGTLSRLADWAEVWNVHVDEELRRRGIGRWLVGHAAEWLRLGRVQRVAAEYVEGDEVAGAFLRSLGWQQLTRTERGWSRTP